MSHAEKDQKWRRRLKVLQRPPQGWVSVALFLGMLAIVGISLADRRRLFIGPEGLEANATGSLIVAMLAAGLIGFLLARSSLGVVRAHVLGAAAGTAVLLMIAGAAAQGGAAPMLQQISDLEPRLALLSEVLRTDINEWQLSEAIPVTATLLVLGAICWTTAQFGAFSIFRYNRGGPAVVAAGMLLFLNVAMPSLGDEAAALPLIPVLAIFSALSMLLLVRMQLTQQGYYWARRHIADTGEVGRLFLRSSALFVAIVVLGASSLTAMAMVRPPNVDLDDIGAPLDDLSEAILRWLPIIGVSPDDQPAEPGESFEIATEWFDSDGTAFTVESASDLYGNYWWGEAFDEFDGWTWRQTNSSEVEVRGGDVLEASGDAGLFETFPVEVTITPGKGYLVSSGAVLGPSAAVTVDRAVVLRNIDTDKGRAGVWFANTEDRKQPYTVGSSVQDYAGSSGTLTATELRNAGVEYPQWVRDRYLQINENATGPLTKSKRREIEAVADNNPYDRALTLQNQLQEFQYEITFTCESKNVSECLLQDQIGFCQQFASTMVMVLREMKIPARIVNGYLPGGIVDGAWEVPQRAAHSWVEVYFPGYGWIRFDPTPVNFSEELNQSITAFPRALDDALGADSTTAPTPGPGATAEPTFAPDPTFGPGLIEPERPSGGGVGASLIALGSIIVLGLLAGLGLLFYLLRRLPRADAGLAYQGIVSLATRLGHGPHPSQTEYEYAATLSETLPSVREDLYVVADRRVESAYGQRPVSADRSGALRRAYARIRTALLRMSLRRKR